MPKRRQSKPQPLQHPLPDALVELVAARFRVLGEPMRIRILERLREGEASVQEMTEMIGSSQQNLSKHLGVLYQAGIVSRRRDGNFVRYAIADEDVFALCEQVCGGLQRQVAALGAAVGQAAA
jgi:DNA-binding transcriptional ArsR family regulator